MTKVTYKERRFTPAFVEECKVQSQLPESECDYAPQVEGVLACPVSRKPKKKKRGQVPGIIQIDEIGYFAQPQFNEVHTRRHVGSIQNESAKPQSAQWEAKRVTPEQLRGLNRNAIHIDAEGFLKEGPKKVNGFGQLRDLLEKQ